MSTNAQRAFSLPLIIALALLLPAAGAAAQTQRRSRSIIDAPATRPAPAPRAPDAHDATPAPEPAALPTRPAPQEPAAEPETPRHPAVNVKIPRQTRVNISWQIALEAADFSPGIIDGHFQRRGLMAAHEYTARFFPGLSPFDRRVIDSLKVNPDEALATYTITDDDAAQVGGPLPADWNAKARLDRLRYESLADCITEKFHCTRVLLETLNPGIRLEKLEPGQTLNVPNLRPFPSDDNTPVVPRHNAQSAYVTINLAEKTIRIFDQDNNQLALFHCSIARDKANLPARDTSVKAIAAPNPDYTFEPRMWPEVHDVTQVLTIKPGPRNPVGIAWVSLELPGYGIHGTPKPELIGKTGSHGCFRLTNWDALKFAGMVREGLPVKILNPEHGG